MNTPATQRPLAPGADWDGTPAMIRKPLGPKCPPKGARKALKRRGFDNADVLQGAGIWSLGDGRGKPLGIRTGHISR